MKKLKEAEERARNRPRVFKEPKSKSVQSWETLYELIWFTWSLNILCCMSATECPPLGMESHKIEPDQLSASSMSQYSFTPQRARLNMQVHNQSWSASLNTAITYIQDRRWHKHQLPDTCCYIMLLWRLQLPVAALVAHDLFIVFSAAKQYNRLTSLWMFLPSVHSYCGVSYVCADCASWKQM